MQMIWEQLRSACSWSADSCTMQLIWETAAGPLCSADGEVGVPLGERRRRPAVEVVLDVLRADEVLARVVLGAQAAGHLKEQRGGGGGGSASAAEQGRQLLLPLLPPPHEVDEVGCPVGTARGTRPHSLGDLQEKFGGGGREKERKGRKKKEGEEKEGGEEER